MEAAFYFFLIRKSKRRSLAVAITKMNASASMILVAPFFLLGLSQVPLRDVQAEEAEGRPTKTPEQGGMLKGTTIEQSPLAAKLVNMSRAQLHNLREGKARGLLELKPVVLPEPEFVIGKNNHFGWPIATRAGDALVVIYLRRCSHFVAPQWDEDSSGCMMIRSLDEGRSWSKPFDLRNHFREPDGSLRYFSKGESIATTSDGAIVLGHKDGTYRSEDQGMTWRHFPHPFRKTLEPGVRSRMYCPRMIEHPDYGLVRMEGTILKPEFPGWPHTGQRMHAGYSRDGGRTWHDELHDVPIAGSAEPAMVFHDGALFMIGRPHDVVAYDPKSHTTRYIQYWSKTGWFPLEAKLTNMRTTDRPKSGLPGKGLDTVDLCFNPVTKRLEVVATDRMGGGVEGRFWDVPFSLNLWSIDPKAMLAGSANWRFEGCLFERQASMTLANQARMSDGCHPAAAVIDEKERVQHIFVYLGSPSGPAGIFHLRRTLDTPRLAAFLKESGKNWTPQGWRRPGGSKQSADIQAP